jgi:hypothetical protein
MKQIRLKDRIHIIEACTSEECPCFECHIDTGYSEAQYGDSCNLGVKFGYPHSKEFPEDCPLEEYLNK